MRLFVLLVFAAGCTVEVSREGRSCASASECFGDERCDVTLRQCVPLEDGEQRCDGPPRIEVCDRRDNDCDGEVDEGCTACRGEEGGSIQVFSLLEADKQMIGCAGRVRYLGRDSLCPEDWWVCGVQDYVKRRGDVVPDHQYWTKDDLRWGPADGGDHGNCWVSTSQLDTHCDEPMRVCMGPSDPLGNKCTWYDCGWRFPSPNEYFGGCSGNTTAGSLCCTLISGR